MNRRASVLYLLPVIAFANNRVLKKRIESRALILNYRQSTIIGIKYGSLRPNFKQNVCTHFKTNRPSQPASQLIVPPPTTRDCYIIIFMQPKLSLYVVYNLLSGALLSVIKLKAPLPLFPDVIILFLIFQFYQHPPIHSLRPSILYTLQKFSERQHYCP